METAPQCESRRARNTRPPAPRALLLADDFNPDRPSLLVVGFKYARALAQCCDVTVATYVHNRENVERVGDALRVVYVEHEWNEALLAEQALHSCITL